MLTPEQRAEGRRLLEAMTPGTWSFSDGAIHTEDESGGAWVPSYMDNLGELNETALADGLAIEWLIRNRQALLAEPPDVEAVKRDAVREFAESLRISFRCRAEICRNAGCLEECTFWELHARRGLSEFCNRKGVNLQ